ncbi:MAG: hypothetical protein DMG53_06365 [Acidobacteria bacterium]|nr:MAG: hypothetical protein DMG53_06365 [Acidobacteriota bacterium]
MPGERVLRAQQVVRAAPQLSVHDGFAFALAETHPGCILLTGDGYLRKLAATNKIEVHGFLWVVDEIHQNRLSPAKILCAALRLLAGDSAVRLPRRGKAYLAATVMQVAALEAGLQGMCFIYPEEVKKSSVYAKKRFRGKRNKALEFSLYE